MLATAASPTCSICNQAVLPSQRLYRNGRYQQHVECGRMQDRGNQLSRSGDMEANKSNSSRVKVKAKVTVKVKVQ